MAVTNLNHLTGHDPPVPTCEEQVQPSSHQAIGLFDLKVKSVLGGRFISSHPPANVATSSKAPRAR